MHELLCHSCPTQAMPSGVSPSKVHQFDIPALRKTDDSFLWVTPFKRNIFDEGEQIAYVDDSRDD